jgi:undecaprenyl pyrophosphate phosphatase UppP
MTGGLLAGLRHQEAAKLSFLLATRVAGHVSARFLIRYFQSGRLDPIGAGALLLLAAGP